MQNISEQLIEFRSISKLLANRLHALDSLPTEGQRLLFLSLTPDERMDLIGRLTWMSDTLGILLDLHFLSPAPRPPRTDSTT